jgi:DASS family divalent anion:Na+ symporter
MAGHIESCTPSGVSREEGGAVASKAPEDLLRNVVFFQSLDRVDIARMIGELEEVSIPAGMLLFTEGAEADALYLLAAGRVRVSVEVAGGERSLAELEAPSSFGELGLLLARRTSTVRAITDVRAWKLPRDRFERLVRDRPAVSLAVATAAVELLEASQRNLVGAPPAERPKRRPTVPTVPPRRHPRAWRIAGFAAAVGVPLALWPLPPPDGLSPAGWHVSLIVLGAALGWLLEPVPDFVIALLMAAAWGVAGLAPVPLILSGFASSSWLVSLGAFGLAVAMVRSGLLYRTALQFLTTFPATQVGQVFGLLISGILVTPLVPFGLARIAAVAPLTRDLAQTLGYPAHSRASAALAFAGLVGYGLFSSVFLTGLAMNFFVLDLLPPADRQRFDWLTWLASAAAAGAITFVGAALALLVLFRAEVAPKTSATVLRRQERVLGPMSRHERVTLAALALLLVGLLVQPLLHVDAAWLAVGALAIALAGGSLDREGFRGAIDWGFLTLFGVLLGTGQVLQSVEVDRWIGDSLIPLAQAIGNPGALVIVLGLVVYACRLVLPWIPATLLLSLVFVPVAPRLGLSPWVVGFVVLTTANTWLLPNQSDIYRLTRSITESEMFTDRQGLLLGAATSLITLVAITASVAYWRAIGVLAP